MGLGGGCCRLYQLDYSYGGFLFVFLGCDVFGGFFLRLVAWSYRLVELSFWNCRLVLGGFRGGRRRVWVLCVFGEFRFIFVGVSWVFGDRVFVFSQVRWSWRSIIRFFWIWCVVCWRVVSILRSTRIFCARCLLFMFTSVLLWISWCRVSRGR